MNKESNALLEILFRALLELRSLGWRGIKKGSLSKKELQMIVDISDTVHNLPLLIKKEHCDAPFLIDVIEELKSFDAKYPEKSRLCLFDIYQDAKKLDLKVADDSNRK